MIGILSSLGAKENSLSKIFIYQGINIVLKGMIPANIVFLIISIIQNKFKLIKLNPNDYYLDSIPFILDPVYIISLNSIFIVITSIILSLTFVSVIKYSPIKNINS